VRFLGGRRDAWRVFQASDAFVLPTTAEVWGATVVEAMAAGIPPIVTEVAGSAVAVEDGVTGIVLPEPFDPRTLRDAIERLAADPSLRSAMGRAAAAAAESHTWRAHGERVEEDLLRVAAGEYAPLERRRRRRRAVGSAVSMVR
jgi:glycosyltransferase involved in cell wall biosynthesis